MINPLPTPVSPSEFSTLMQGFALGNNAVRLGIAASGGPDSMALAFLAQQWARENNTEIYAFIVDHALRPESAEEAVTTHKRLAAQNIHAKILTWHHAPITSRVHITARHARYDLLCEACLRHNISTLMTAHQAEDQAETILMRIAKGSGIEGLAGISADTQKDKIRMIRPLLPIEKARLIATCDAAKIAYVTDPSNMSEKYARGRLRNVLPLLAQEGLTIARLNALGERAHVAKEALDHYTQEFITQSVTQDMFGNISIEHDAARHVPRAILERAMSQCLNTIHPASYAPEYTSLTALLDALAAPDAPTRTLHGCRITRRGGVIFIMREVALITDAPTLAAGQSVLWDARWQVTLPATVAGTYTIRPLGTPTHEVLDRLAPKLRHALPQGRARATLPALWEGEKLTLIPSFSTEMSILSTATAKLIRVLALR